MSSKWTPICKKKELSSLKERNCVRNEKKNIVLTVKVIPVFK